MTRVNGEERSDDWKNARAAFSVVVRTSERSERDPGPIATDARFAKAGAAAHSSNCHRWLWVPAFAGTTSGVCCASRFAKAGPFFLHERLRLKSNFLSRIKLFLPVQSPPKKYSDFPKIQISL
jgi:hypothetical protein